MWGIELQCQLGRPRQQWRPRLHGLADRLDVLRLRAIDPGGVRIEHRLHAVPVLLGDPQQILAEGM